MTDRLRDTVLIVVVLTALLFTASAFYGLGRRLPPAPEVRPTPASDVAPHLDDPR